MTVWHRLARWCLQGSGLVIVSPQQLLDLDTRNRELARDWAMLRCLEEIGAVLYPTTKAAAKRDETKH